MINCALVYGTDSPEHDVSVVTAAEIMKNAPSRGIRLYPLYVRGGRWFTGNGLADVKSYSPFDPEKFTEVRLAGKTLYVYKRKKLVPYAVMDCALIAAHGGMGENGALQGFLDVNGIPYCSSGVFASAVGMNKTAAKILVSAAGVPVAEWFVPDEKDPEDTLKKAENIGYPLIFKPNSGGSSLGIAVSESAADVKAAVETASGFGCGVICEKYIENACDVNVAVLSVDGKKIVSRPERMIKSGKILSFGDKYAPKSDKVSVFPADIPPETELELVRLALICADALGTEGVVRFDFLLCGKKILFNEVNTVPGSLATYLFPEFGTTDFLRNLIEAASHKQLCCFRPQFDTGLLKLKPKGRKKRE